MNKKGITLVEVIISVGLISLVMLFLFNLLIDMQYEENHAVFSKSNQLNRAAIIKYMENEFLKYELKAANVLIEEDKAIVSLDFDTFTRNLEVTSNSVSYYNGDEAWNMEDENASYDFKKVKISNSTLNDTCTTYLNPNTDAEERACSNYYYIKIVIPVKTNEKDNIQDDIELFYLGRLNS